MESNRELFNRFGIKFVSRNDIKTNFTVTRNDSVIDNLEDVMKILCFYTISLLETSTADQIIHYKKDGAIKQTHILDACYDVFIKCLIWKEEQDKQRELTKQKELEKLAKQKEYEEDEAEEEDEEEEEEEESEKSEESDKINTFYKFSDCIKKHYYPKFNDLHKLKKEHPVIRYKMKHESFVGNGYSDKNESVTSFTEMWSFDYDRKINCKTSDHGRGEETVGNYGSYVEDLKLVKSEGEENKWSMFDLDKFQIISNKINDNHFYCTFTPINKLHHAASMWARPCTVETNLDTIYVDLVTRVDLYLTYTDDEIIVRTEYFGIDVL